MTLYDEYRKQYPINPEPSEFRDIVESEIKRVIAWMKGRKPMPAEDIKPGRYTMTAEVIVEKCCHAEIGCGIKCRGLVYGLKNTLANHCLESVVNGDATFQAVGEVKDGD